MASLADSLVSSAARRLPLRKRPDLTARRQTYLGRSYWVVKEPIGLNYYRFQDEEFAILNMLDGEVCLDEIKQRFEAEFPPQKITIDELQQFLGMLHRSGLVIASAPNQGRQLHKRRDERRRKEFLGAISNILCIRFKGFDPERILNWLHPKIGWLFSRAAFTLSLILILAAVTLVIVQFDVFRSRLPGFYQFFSPTNALLLAITLGLTKVFHEFGHGLACKHFGGECHEMGVMILVLTPCLYCNVSDSWMLPSKWQRAAIGAAGMYVEVTLASLATFVWWFSEPGLLNYLALNVMFIASVTTLLFNANPLLRYDGYYILADLMEIPNLRQKATSILSRKMGELLLGIEPPEDPFLPQRNQVLFAAYSIAAAAYRWFVMASILWFLYQVFKPYKLQIIGQMIAAMSLYGLIVVPLYKLAKFFYVPGRVDKVKKPRMIASMVVTSALVAAVLLAPLPNRIPCTLEIQARDARPVYVDVEGRLESIDVAAGDRVETGQQLALLVNPEVNLEIVRLQGEVERYETQLRTLRRLGFRDRDAAATIPQVEESLATAREQLWEEEEYKTRLRLVAPIAGIVLPPPEKTGRGENSMGQLASWSGTPLRERNRGAMLESSVLFCRIGDPRQVEATLIIDQIDRNHIKKGQRVDVMLAHMPGVVLEGRIESIAESELELSPERLSTRTGGDLPTITDPETGIERPQSTSYQARVPLGLYGSDRQRAWLRGRLEQTEEDAWRLHYVAPTMHMESAPDVVTLVESDLMRGYRDGDYVEVRGQPGEAAGEYLVESLRRLNEANGLLCIGLRGKAKVHTQWIPLGTRLWRFFVHTFQFKL